MTGSDSGILFISRNNLLMAVMLVGWGKGCGVHSLSSMLVDQELTKTSGQLSLIKVGAFQFLQSSETAGI